MSQYHMMSLAVAECILLCHEVCWTHASDGRKIKHQGERMAIPHHHPHSATRAMSTGTDGFQAETIHMGTNDYRVKLSTGEEIGGFTQFGQAFQWASATARAGLAEWEARKAYAPQEP
jgi:hypothetical protein